MQSSLVLKIPTINNDFASYANLFKLWAKVNTSDLDVEFSFSECNFLQNNAVAFLGGLVKLIEYNNGRVSFNLDKIRDDVYTNLAQNNFFAHCGLKISPWDGNSVHLRHDLDISNKDDYIHYLTTNWLWHEWVNFSTRLRNDIVDTVCEIYVNAFEHSQSPIGALTCGQFFPKPGDLKLSLVDFGVGISHNVRSLRENQNMGVADALKWAFAPGTSTKKGEGIARGLGLSTLSDFIKSNLGEITIYSGHCWGRINKDGMKAVPLATNTFPGTLITITIKCDEKYYSLPSETPRTITF